MKGQAARLLTAAAVSLAYVLPILAMLLAPVRGSTQAPLNLAPPDELGVPLFIRGRASVEPDGTFFVHQVWLRTRSPERLLAHQQIGLAVVAFGTEPGLEDGELRFPADGCSYRTKRGTTFPDNAHLFLLRRGGCDVTRPASHELLLRLRFRHPAHVAIWTWRRPPGWTPEDAVAVSSFGAAEPNLTYLAQGVVVDVDPADTAPRLDLLAYVWDISPSGAWIMATLTAAGMLVAAAVVLGWRTPESRSWRLPSAAFCAAAGFSAMYAVVVPPFQSADEPNHFMALAGYYARPELGNQSTSLARRGHFEEIQFHAERHFTPKDRRAPGIPWNDGIAPDAARGVGASALWRAIGPFVRDLPVARLLLTMRVLHALVFALSAAAFVAIVQWTTDAPQPGWLAVPLFLVPAFPYFAAYMSNYAPLVSAYTIFAAGVGAVVWGSPHRRGTLLILGASMVAAMAISRSAIPMLPFAASVIAAGMSGNALGRLLDRAPSVVAAGGWSLVAILIILFAGSLVVRYPPLAPITPRLPPPAWTYVTHAVFACATFLRFGVPDHLTSMTFWGGFGWLDALPPPLMAQFLASAGGLTLIALAVWIAKTRAARSFAVLLCVMAGFVLSAGAYAYSLVCLAMADLHGRYLLGLYLCALVIAWSGAARAAAALPMRWRVALIAAAVAGCVAAQAYGVSVILRRYF
jgi:hypothetical protein